MPYPELTQQESQEWRALLLGEPGGTLLPYPVTSGYTSDTIGAGQKDHLSIQPDVDAFARLVCLKETAPPLAIALFGAWGSGKTFFMRKMQDAVRALCEEQRTAPDQGGAGTSAFATEIRQIEFNAWTYADKNLLASLAVELFEKLLELTTGETRTDSDGVKYNEALLKELETANAAKHAAKAQKKAADKNLEVAVDNLSKARAKADQRRAALAATESRDFMSELAKQAIDPDSDVGKSLTQLGLSGITKTAADVSQLRDQTSALAGRLRLLASRFVTMRGWRSFVLWAVLLVIAGLSFYPAACSAWLPDICSPNSNPLFIQLSAAAATGIAYVKVGLKSISSALEPIESAAAEYDRKRAEIEAQINADTEIAQQAVLRQEEEVARLAADLRSKEAAAAQALAAVDADTPLVRLNRFIRERADTSDYRQHLGIVRLLKDDFERLAHLMKNQQGPDRNDDLPRIDRIILYIDDLDRCKPATVKAVMEAVHLLLSSDLFVVVVGADEKWVSKSLSTEYSALLTETRGESDQATSADFIEKIFQVPFWLSPMTRTDMESFLDGLLKGQSEPTQDGAIDLASLVTGKVLDKAAVRRNREKTATAEDLIGDIDESPPVLPPPIPVRERVETIELVRFTAAEVAFMRLLGPMIGRTPRAAKRYVNLYRLIRARLHREQLRTFLGRGKNGQPPAFPVVQFLLALETSHETVANGLDLTWQQPALEFQNVRVSLEAVDAERTVPESIWRGLDSVEITCSYRLPDDVDDWARRVARYSFRRSRWVS